MSRVSCHSPVETGASPQQLLEARRQFVVDYYKQRALADTTLNTYRGQWEQWIKYCDDNGLPEVLFPDDPVRSHIAVRTMVRRSAAREKQ